MEGRRFTEGQQPGVEPEPVYHRETELPQNNRAEPENITPVAPSENQVTSIGGVPEASGSVPAELPENRSNSSITVPSADLPFAAQEQAMVNIFENVVEDPTDG